MGRMSTICGAIIGAVLWQDWMHADILGRELRTGRLKTACFASHPCVLEVIPVNMKYWNSISDSDTWSIYFKNYVMKIEERQYFQGVTRDLCELWNEKLLIVDNYIDPFTLSTLFWCILLIHIYTCHYWVNIAILCSHIMYTHVKILNPHVREWMIYLYNIYISYLCITIFHFSINSFLYICI